jgi:ABC-type multidrug transport system fused ATPase/permease subunit
MLKRRLPLTRPNESWPVILGKLSVLAFFLLGMFVAPLVGVYGYTWQQLKSGDLDWFTILVLITSPILLALLIANARRSRHSFSKIVTDRAKMKKADAKLWEFARSEEGQALDRLQREEASKRMQDIKRVINCERLEKEAISNIFAGLIVAGGFVLIIGMAMVLLGDWYEGWRLFPWVALLAVFLGLVFTFVPSAFGGFGRIVDVEQEVLRKVNDERRLSGKTFLP